jgi:hypothetical protein
VRPPFAPHVFPLPTGNKIDWNYVGVGEDGRTPGGFGTGIFIGQSRDNLVAHNTVAASTSRDVLLGGEQNTVRDNNIGIVDDGHTPVSNPARTAPVESR